MHTATAIRSDVDHDKGTATVTVTHPDGRTEALSGRRAFVAQAALLVRWDEDDTLGVYGLRSDFDRARSEAAALLVATRRRRAVAESAVIEVR